MHGVRERSLYLQTLKQAISKVELEKKNENKEDSRVQYKLIHEDKGFAK